jgi:hypothetical protein
MGSVKLSSCTMLRNIYRRYTEVHVGADLRSRKSLKLCNMKMQLDNWTVLCMIATFFKHILLPVPVFPSPLPRKFQIFTHRENKQLT